MQGYRAPIEGFKTFVTKPYLWLGPLFWSLVSAGILAVCFFVVMVYMWPVHQTHLSYLFGVLKAFGYGLFGVLVAWLVLFPFVLAMAFEGMLKKLFVERRLQVKSEGFLISIQSAVFITWKTLLIRIIWVLVAFISVWSFAPLGIFLTHMGFAHIALLDGADLSLAMLGRDKHFRLGWIQRHHFPLIMGGFIGGALSLFLSITVIGWLFLLPSLYVGSCLFVLDD